MKRTFKTMTAMVLTLMMLLSLVCVSVLADGETGVLLLSNTGIAYYDDDQAKYVTVDAEGRAAVYPSGAHLGLSWSAGGAALCDTADLVPGNVKMRLPRLSIASSTPLLNATAWDEGVSHIGADRYALIPLLKSTTSAAVGTTPSSSNTCSFSSKFTNFATSTLTLDVIKNGALWTNGHLDSVKMGFAYIDFSTPVHYTSGSSRTVYPHDVVWVDVTSTASASSGYTASKTYDAQKKVVTLDIANVFENGSHQSFNGASTSVTPANANAFVIDLKLTGDDAATYSQSGTALIYNNVVITEPAGGDDPTEPQAYVPKSFPIWTHEGTSGYTGSSVYDATSAYIYESWSPNSTLALTVKADFYPDSNVIKLPYLSPAKNGLAAQTNLPEGVTTVDGNRYRMMPLATAGNGYPNTSLTFKNISNSMFDWSKGYITFEALKGASYGGLRPKIENFKVGLAHLDYTNYTVSYSGNKAYRTDIAWYDITDQVVALAGYNKTLSWDEQHGLITVNVSDILASTNHQYLHGATAENCTVNADNANAFVLGITMVDGQEDFFQSSQYLLMFDDVIIHETPPVTEFGFSGSIENGVALSCPKNYGTEITPVVVIAYYDQGTLTDLTIDTDLTIGAGEEDAINTYLIGSVEPYDSVKVFAFDSFATMKPLCPCFSENVGE